VKRIELRGAELHRTLHQRPQAGAGNTRLPAR